MPTGNTQQVINYGAYANDGQGDPLRTAFIKTDENFDNIWLAGPAGSNIRITNNTIGVLDTNGNLILSPNGVGIIQTNNHVVPRANKTYDLGTANLQYRTVYANTATFQTLALNSDLTVSGNLTVAGNIIEMGNIVSDALTIQLANTAITDAQANGAGLTVGANDDIATLLYSSGNNVWTTNIGLQVGGPLTATSIAVSDATIYGNLAGVDADFTGNITANYFLGNGSQLTGVTNYTNANAVAYGEAGWAGNIVPSGNAVYALGNATNQWSDLYVSNTTIYMNNVPISLGAGNVLTVNGNAVLSNDSNTSIATTGNITADYFVGDGSQLTGIVSNKIYNGNSYANIDTPNGNVVVSANGSEWTFAGDGNLTAPGAINVGNMSIGQLPGYITANANTGITLNVSGTDGGFAVNYIGEEGNGNSSGGELAFNSELGNATYRISLSDDLGDGFATKIWRFDGTGNLSLPSGGSLYSEGFTPSGNPGNTVILNPHGSGSITNQKLMIYPTAGDGDHIHMATGNLYETELFLGNDNFYVKLASTGNVVINSNDNVGNSAAWTFGYNGTTVFPGNLVGSGASPAPSISGFDSVSAVTLSASGNITANYLLGNGSGLTNLPAPTVAQDIASVGAMSIMLYDGTIKYNNYATVEPASGNITGGNISATGNVSGNYILGNGSQLTGLPAGYTDANATTLLSNLGSNVISGTGNITTTGNISGGYILGNGSQLTGLPATYGNSNVAGFMAAFGSNTISTTGNITAGNIIGNISITGNVTGTSSNVDLVASTYTWSFNNTGNLVLPGNTFAVNYANGTAVALGGNYGNSNVTSLLASLGSNTVSTTGNVTSGNLITAGAATTGINALLAGPTFTPLANTSAGFVANVNNYTQVTFQNKNTGADATADYILTADNGTDTVNYSDFGIINSGYDNSTPTNSLGNIVFAADTYLYAQGNASNASQSGGNLAIGTTIPGKNVKIFAGGVTNSSIIANISNTGIAVNGNVTATNFIGNISITGNVIGTSPNVSLSAGSFTATFDNTGILTLPACGGDEGGEINFGIPASNTTLTTRVVTDVYQDKFRIFDGSTKGVYVDLSQAAVGVGTLLNNRVAALVNAGTFVTMDNIKATVTGSAPRGLSLATVSGTFSYNIGGNFATTGGPGASVAAGQTLTTTATSSIFGWGFTTSGDLATYVLTDTTNSRCYRITLQIGGSFNNNAITIERLI